MTGTISACALVVIVFVLGQGVTALKPKMTPEVEELLIQEGDELKIACQGERRIQFSTQQFPAYVVQSKFMGSFNEATGTYTFIRPNTTRQDTGWYACAEEGIRIRNDVETIEHPSEEISWIYVYVNSSEPFAVMQAYFEATLITAGNDGVVPCRPTSPNLPVKLEIQGGEVPVPENTAYDPKIGFILKAVGIEHNGEMYACKLEGTYPEDANWPLYYALVEDFRSIDRPTIIQDTLHHVVWGQDLTLECRITVEGHTFNLNWTVPSSIPKHRIHYPEKIKYVEQTGGKETWEVEVTIKDVQETDGGEYICTARDVHGNQKESSTTVKIWDPSYTYINITVEGNKDVLSHEGDTVQWKIIIDTYPKILTVEWYKEDGTMIAINEENPRTIRFSHTQTGIIHIFKISKLTIKDNGRYTVRVTTLQNVDSIILPLIVIGQPINHIDSNFPLYAPGVSADFVCRAIASPPPNITWKYIEYPDFPSKKNSTVIIPHSNLHKEWIEKPPFHLTSRVNMTINMTGDIICKSCNDVGCTENIQQIFVSDVPGFFVILNPGMITEGDDISLTCGASVYNYTDSVEWKYKDFREHEFNSERMNITKRKTKFTWQSILHIRNVSQSDSGEYTCESVNNERHPERETYQLRVKVARAPEFTYTNMNNSKIPINLIRDKNKAVILECRADGRPIPKIIWHKDNELIKESNQYKFLEHNTKLQILYFSDADIDSGRYACKAVNRIGTAERYMDILIAGKSDNTTLWISLSCVVIAIIITAIIYKIIKVHRK